MVSEFEFGTFLPFLRCFGALWFIFLLKANHGAPEHWRNFVLKFFHFAPILASSSVLCNSTPMLNRPHHLKHSTPSAFLFGSLVSALIVCSSLSGCSASAHDAGLSATDEQVESAQSEALYQEWDSRYQVVLSDKEEARALNKRFITEGARPCLVDEYEQSLNKADSHLSAALDSAIRLNQANSRIVAYPLRQTMSSYGELAQKYRYLGERYKRTNSLDRAERISKKLAFVEQTARLTN